MPSFNITIPETIESVSRPIIYSVFETIKKYLLIRDNVRVIFPGDIGSWTQTAGDLKNKTKESQFTSSRYVNINVEQEPVETNLNSTAVYYAENPPIILDDQLQVQVTPVYSHTQATIDIQFVTYNKDEAFRWYYNARTQIAKMQDVYINTIRYHYPLPDPLMDLIETIYKLKENVNPDNESYQDYVVRTFTKRATMLSSFDGTAKRVGISETQTRMLGRFEFGPLPEKPTLIENNQAWVCTFKYIFTYDLPMSLNIRYPLMVHNQFLPEPFLNYSFDPYYLDDKDLVFPATLKALRAFEPPNLFQWNIPFRIPKIDDFTPKYIIPGTKMIFSAMIQLETTNLQYLLNLNDLDYLSLDNSILTFIKNGEYRYVTEPFQSVINISLFCDNHLQISELITCKEDLSIWATSPLDINKTYRIVFSLVSNFADLSAAAIYRLFYASGTCDTPTLPLMTSSTDQLSSTINASVSSFADILGTSATVSPSASATVENSDITYLYGNSSLPVNLNTIENYIHKALTDKPVLSPIQINKNTNTSNYSPFYSSMNDYQKYLTIENPFSNPNNRPLSQENNGSCAFDKITTLLNLTPTEINNIYRNLTGKNLYNNTSTTNNFLYNSRSVIGDKSLALISNPLYNQSAVQNYIGFKTVMVSGVVAISSSLRGV